MIQITPKFVKIVDILTVEDAPEMLNGISGFKHNKNLCLKHGYKELKLSPQAGNTAMYEDKGEYIEQSWVNIDQDEFAQRVNELIRAEYSLESELSVQRRRNDNVPAFNEYNAFCEHCIKRAKIEQIKGVE